MSLYEDIEVPGPEPECPPDKCPAPNAAHIYLKWEGARRRWLEWQKKVRRYNLSVAARRLDVLGPEVCPSSIAAMRSLIMLVADEILRKEKET